VIWGNKWKFILDNEIPHISLSSMVFEVGEKLEMCLKEVKRKESLDACVIYEIENLSVDVQHFMHCFLFFFLHEMK
jgi:hypothetical protein